MREGVVIDEGRFFKQQHSFRSPTGGCVNGFDWWELASKTHLLPPRTPYYCIHSKCESGGGSHVWY